LVLSFQRKNFFFEKKKQKTFIRWVGAHAGTAGDVAGDCAHAGLFIMVRERRLQRIA
jgi:hypothetical protein